MKTSISRQFYDYFKYKCISSFSEPEKKSFSPNFTFISAIIETCAIVQTTPDDFLKCPSLNYIPINFHAISNEVCFLFGDWR